MRICIPNYHRLKIPEILAIITECRAIFTTLLVSVPSWFNKQPFKFENGPIPGNKNCVFKYCKMMIFNVSKLKVSYIFDWEFTVTFRIKQILFQRNEFFYQEFLILLYLSNITFIVFRVVKWSFIIYEEKVSFFYPSNSY